MEILQSNQNGDYSTGGNQCLQNCKHHIFPNKFSQLKQCHYWKAAQEIQCNQKNLRNKCWQKKKKEVLWTHNNGFEINATLNIGGTLNLVLVNNSLQILFVD